jgi:hypothetical protein
MPYARPRSAPRLVAALLAVALAPALSGCTAWSERFAGFELFRSGDDKPPKPQVPVRLTALWTHTVLNQPGLPGVRGFGGRVMFYGKRGEQPIAVDGVLTVYAFDSTDADPQHAVPERRFVFPQEDLASHYSRSGLGPSYSFWIPWDEVGGPHRDISLTVRFEPTAGGAVMSDLAKQVLPGVARTAGRPTARPGVPADAVQPAAHHQPAASLSPDRMTTDTIMIPGGSLLWRTTSLATAESLPAVPNGPLPAGLASSGTPAAAAPAPPAAPAPAATAEAPPPATLPSPAVSLSHGVRFARRRSPAPAGPTPGPAADPVRRLPHPARWQSALPPTPRFGPTALSRTNVPVDPLAPAPPPAATAP